MEKDDIEEIKNRVEKHKSERNKEVDETRRKRDAENDEIIRKMKTVIDSVEELRESIESIDRDIRLRITDKTVTASNNGMVSNDSYTIMMNRGITLYKLKTVSSSHSPIGFEDMVDIPERTTEEAEFYKTPKEAVNALMDKVLK